MKFNIVKCPKCNNINITEINIIGTPCKKCSSFLNKDDKELKNEAFKEQAKIEKIFSENFDEFKRRMERWKSEQVYVKYEVYDIPDKQLISFIIKDKQNTSGLKM